MADRARGPPRRQRRSHGRAVAARWTSGKSSLNLRSERWLQRSDPDEFSAAARALERLESRGVLLGEPLSRHLGGKLRELRFFAARRAVRITYFILPDRRIVLLTVFYKQRQRERSEIARAMRAMQRCIDTGHTADED